MIASSIDGITERSEELTKKALDVGEIKDFMKKSVNVAKDINEAVKRGDADMKD